jgi:hypothetical protein
MVLVAVMRTAVEDFVAVMGLKTSMAITESSVWTVANGTSSTVFTLYCDARLQS